MSDVIDRLVAADPAVGSRYEHPDLAAMTARILAHPTERPRGWWRDFRLKMAGAVSTSALLTVAAIVALEAAAPSLSILALSSTSGEKFATSAPVATMRVNAQYRFVPGPAISTATGSAPAIELRVAANPTSEVTRIATVFSVSGSAPVSSGDGALAITGPNGAIVTYQAAGSVPQWTYSDGSAPPGPVATSSVAPGQGAVVTTPARSNFAVRARRYLARLALPFQVGSPATSWTSDPNLAVTAQPPLDRQVLTYPVTVSGVATGLDVVFMFDTGAKLLWASGPDFGAGGSTNYPLSSPASAVASLSAQRARAAAPNAAAPNRVDVDLMSVVLTLRSFRLADGTDWMLPTYVFSQLSGTSTMRWWIVALDPSYLRSGATATSGVLANGPINY